MIVFRTQARVISPITTKVSMLVFLRILCLIQDCIALVFGHEYFLI